jgi:hypothetical protein
MFLQPNGNFKLDVRCTVKMEDGSLIFVEYVGIIKLNKSGQEKFQKGQLITPSDAYFMTAPTMQTTSEKYAWVNDAMFVEKFAVLQPPGEGKKPFVRYDVYMVVP